MSRPIPEDLSEPADEYALLDTSEAGGKAIRGSILRTLAFGGSLALGVVSAPLLVRHLGSVEFGRYATVLAVIAIVTGLTEGGVNSIAIRNLSAARTSQQRTEILRDLLGLRVALSAAGLVAAVAFAAIAGYGGTLVLGTLLAGIGMVMSVSQALLAAVLQSSLRFGMAALIEFGRGLLTTVLIIVLVAADAGVLAFLAIVIPAALLSLVATTRVLGDTEIPRPAFAPARWVPMLRETAVFALATAANTLYFRITLVIMSLVATAGQTGTFAVSLRIMEVLVGLPGLLISGAFPIISRTAASDRERFQTASARLFELAVIAGTFTTVGTALVAPFVVEVVTGVGDHPAVDVLRIQSIALVPSSAAAALGYAILGLHKHREALVANVSTLVLVVVLTLVLVPSQGAEGAAIAAVAADFALVAFLAFYLVQAGGPALSASTVVVVAVGGGGGYALGALTGLHPILEAAVGLAVFLAVLAATGKFPPEVRELAARGRRSSTGR